ncbi:MAG TPA: VWA domain-containing protein [Thiothrix sp.]|nr:VWA domain-containing protein [Thiothrix sp.]
MEISFALPWLFLLLPLPLLVIKFVPPAPITTPSALRIPFFTGLQAGLVQHKRSRSPVWLIVAVLTWLALLTSAARPQLVGESINIPISGRSLMMAVDISGSMQEPDMFINSTRVTRLTAVKAVASDFINKRKGDRIGLILFGSKAYLQAPLTFDRKTVNILLNEAQIGLAGKKTAIGDAIGLAVKRLRKQPETNRLLIFLTDGANTAGIEPMKAADLAAQEKIKVYAIGIGGSERIVQTPFGRQRVGGSDLDEDNLKAIASKTGGQYFRAEDVESLLKIYDFLDKIEPISNDELNYRPVDELYHWPLAIALIMSLFIAIGSSGILNTFSLAHIVGTHGETKKDD